MKSFPLLLFLLSSFIESAISSASSDHRRKGLVSLHIKSQEEQLCELSTAISKDEIEGERIEGWVCEGGKPLVDICTWAAVYCYETATGSSVDITIAELPTNALTRRVHKINWAELTSSDKEQVKDADENEPSFEPSFEPSIEPSIEPSTAVADDSGYPTSAPTAIPSAPPSSMPSVNDVSPIVPVSSPSVSPSAARTKRPSKQPVRRPSFNPTAVGATMSPSLAPVVFAISQSFTGLTVEDIRNPVVASSIVSVIAYALDVDPSAVAIVGTRTIRRHRTESAGVEVDYTVSYAGSSSHPDSASMSTALSGSDIAGYLKSNLLENLPPGSPILSKVDGISVNDPVVTEVTSAPTVKPTKSPADSSSTSKTRLSQDSVILIVVFTILGFFLLLGGAGFDYYRSKKNRQSIEGERLVALGMNTPSENAALMDDKNVTRKV